MGQRTECNNAELIVLLDKTILVVEDDIITSKLIEITLRGHCRAVLLAQTGQEAFRHMAESKVDAMILDLNLPDIRGLDILSYVRIHPVYKEIPIVILTSTCDIDEVLILLERGADDCIKKPFHNRELIGRLNNAFQRIKGFQAQDLDLVSSNHQFVIDEKTRQVFCGGKKVPLACKEYEILTFLYANQGRVFTRDELMIEVWGEQHMAASRTIDMHMSTLRKKLRKYCRKACIIETIRGVGYRLI